MSELLYIPGVLWQDLGTRTDPECTTIDSLIKKSGANYTVSAYKMYTEVTNNVEGYHAVYRDDDKRLMCVVNNYYPQIIQNGFTFSIMKPLMTAGLVSLEFVSVAAGGLYHYGVFKSTKTYKILDEDIEHYFLVVNDHSKPDGKVSVFNLPVRKKNKTILLCSMTNSAYKLRMPVSSESIHSWKVLLSSSTFSFAFVSRISPSEVETYGNSSSITLVTSSSSIAFSCSFFSLISHQRNASSTEDMI